MFTLETSEKTRSRLQSKNILLMIFALTSLAYWLVNGGIKPPEITLTRTYASMLAKAKINQLFSAQVSDSFPQEVFKFYTLEEAHICTDIGWESMAFDSLLHFECLCWGSSCDCKLYNEIKGRSVDGTITALTKLEHPRNSMASGNCPIYSCHEFFTRYDTPCWSNL